MRSYRKKGQVKAFLITSIDLSLSSAKWVIKGDRVYRKVSPESLGEHSPIIGGFYVEDGHKSFCLSREEFEKVYELTFAKGWVAQGCKATFGGLQEANKPISMAGDDREAIVKVERPIKVNINASVCAVCESKAETIEALKGHIDALTLLASMRLPGEK